MNNIGTLLDTLEIRHSQAVYRSEKKKEAIWDQFPRLKAIDREIAAAGIYLFENKIKGKEDAQTIYNTRIRELENEKNTILQQHGISAKDLEPQFQCEICGDTGFVHGKKCLCLKKMISTVLFSSCDLAPESSEMNFEHFDLNLFPEEFQTRARKTRAFGQQYCARFQEEGNYIFIGKAGRGKTFLCSCIAATLINDGHHIIYITASHLAELARNHAAFERQAEADLLYQSLNDCDLLIIDDFGAEYQTSYSQSALFEIINGRLLKNLKMIISTNLDMKEIAAQYAVRLSSRLTGHFKQLTFPWGDLRVKNLNKINKKA